MTVEKWSTQRLKAGENSSIIFTQLETIAQFQHHPNSPVDLRIYKLEACHSWYQLIIGCAIFRSVTKI